MNKSDSNNDDDDDDDDDDDHNNNNNNAMCTCNGAHFSTRPKKYSKSISWTKSIFPLDNHFLIMFYIFRSTGIRHAIRMVLDGEG